MKHDIFYGPEGPTQRQVAFRDAKERFKLYGGAIGGGKSRALCAEGLRFSMMFEGNRGFMCRGEAKAFKETTLKTLLGLISEIEYETGEKLVKTHSKSESLITLFNGSEILYGGLRGGDNLNRVKSMEVGWFAVDESTECLEDDIDMLESRLRWKLKDGTHPTYHGFYATNPEPGWCKDKFVTPQLDGNKYPNRVFIQALPSDNQWLPADYVEQVAFGKPDYWVDRFLKGSWDAAEGQIWPQFDYNIHVLPNQVCSYNIPIPKSKGEYPIIFGSLDHGLTNPACFLGMYVDYDDNIWVYDEYYQPGLVSEHTRRISKKFNNELFKYRVADPSIWNTTSEKDGDPWSTEDEYAKNGLLFNKANNSVGTGVNRVAEYLTYDKNHIHPGTGQKGSPRLFISNRCVNLISEIRDYAWEKERRNIDSQEKPVKRKDHAVDALRYGVMTRPQPKKAAEQPQAKDTFEYYKKMANFKQRRQSRFQRGVALGHGF